MQSFLTRRPRLAYESDSSLFEKMSKGDQYATQELFCRYYNSLCRFTHRLIHQEQDVEDIVEAVFEKLWLGRGEIQPTKSVRSYLFKSVQNRAIDFLRKNRDVHTLSIDCEHGTQGEAAEPVSYSDPIQDMIDKDFAAAAMEAIERLPRKCKLVFTLKKREGLTYAEIADILEISERTVENQIVRALRHLRADLKDFLV